MFWWLAPHLPVASFSDRCLFWKYDWSWSLHAQCPKIYSSLMGCHLPTDYTCPCSLTYICICQGNGVHRSTASAAIWRSLYHNECCRQSSVHKHLVQLPHMVHISSVSISTQGEALHLLQVSYIVFIEQNMCRYSEVLCLPRQQLCRQVICREVSLGKVRQGLQEILHTGVVAKLHQHVQIQLRFKLHWLMIWTWHTWTHLPCSSFHRESHSLKS